MKKLLPIVMLLLGVGAGVGAGIVLAPSETPEDVAEAETTETPEKADVGETPGATEFVSLSNQFVIPLVGDDRVNALVVMSLSIEVSSGTTTDALAREAKLRDAFLKVLFDHANMGGFEGVFTRSGNINLLRQSLRDAAVGVLGEAAIDVLITDIVRQDT